MCYRVNGQLNPLLFSPSANKSKQVAGITLLNKCGTNAIKRVFRWCCTLAELRKLSRQCQRSVTTGLRWRESNFDKKHLLMPCPKHTSGNDIYHAFYIKPLAVGRLDVF